MLTIPQTPAAAGLDSLGDAKKLGYRGAGRRRRREAGRAGEGRGRKEEVGPGVQGWGCMVLGCLKPQILSGLFRASLLFALGPSNLSRHYIQLVLNKSSQTLMARDDPCAPVWAAPI